MNIKLPVIGLIAFLSFSCTGEKDSTRYLTTNLFTSLPLETIFEFTESEEVAFQQISSIKTDTYGNILVRDFNQPFLLMFDPDGNFLKKIGREGHGPGEFLHISDFLEANGHLWMIEPAKKIEKFGYRNSEYVHVKSISLEKEELAGKFLGKTEDGILIKNWYTLYANRKDNPTERPISLINENGEVLRDSIFMEPIAEQVTLKGSEYRLYIEKIFGNRSLSAFDGLSRSYTLWTDSLAIDAYTIDGNYRRAFSHSLEPVRVTDEERDSVLNRYAPVRSDLSRKLPEVKPIVNNFIMDDHQRIWVELLTEDLGLGWFCFTKEGKPLYKIDIPKKGAEFQEISGNRVLWNYENESGAPTIAVSKINIPEI